MNINWFVIGGLIVLFAIVYVGTLLRAAPMGREDKDGYHDGWGE